LVGNGCAIRAASHALLKNEISVAVGCEQANQNE
jgi:hypothetical protein